jgi:ketosteroid isomerase-like protein
MEQLESSTVGPFFHGDDRFSVVFTGKAKNKETGEVMDMQETATYHVQDGKIVREEFFYAM